MRGAENHGSAKTRQESLLTRLIIIDWCKPKVVRGELSCHEAIACGVCRGGAGWCLFGEKMHA